MRFFASLVAALVLVLTSFGIGPEKRAGTVDAAAGRTMGYGMMASDPSLLAATGFNWIKLFATWKDLHPSRGVFSASNFASLSSYVDNARSKGLNVLLLVERSPGWATGSSSDTAPPINDTDFADFMYYLASYFKGRVAAYEIWNEPNLHYEWGYQTPSPVKYASMLRALYPRVKAADRDALVISGGLSTAGDADPARGDADYGDLLWIKDLYQQGNVKSCSDGAGGLRSCFDALGSHPYGGPFSPETAPSDAQYTVGMYFRRAEQQKQMMDVWGADYGRGIWATEFNWLIDPAAFGVSCNWGSGWDRYKLTGNKEQQEATQADYLQRAYQYAYNNWPWMQGLILFNLNFYQRDNCDQVLWYALLRKDGSRRPAYNAMANMAKPGIVSPILQLSTNQAFVLLQSSSPNAASRIIGISNGSSGPLGWTATTSGQSWLKVSTASSPTPANTVSSVAPSSLIITVNKSGLANNTYTGTVTVTGSAALNSPQQIVVKMFLGTVYQAGITVQKNQ